MRVAVYYRVSTKGQGDDDKLGLPSQRASVEKYCAKQGHTIAATFEDIGHSGATADRPALSAMLLAASTGAFESVIVPKWDRLARDTMLDGFLRFSFKRAGVAVLSATESNGVDPMSDLTQSILAAVAQFERHLIRQRLTSARRIKGERGGYAHGRPRYGMKAQDGQLVPDRAELETIAVARALRRARKPLRAIAAELNKRGLPTKSGKPWGASSVHMMLGRRTPRASGG